MHVCLGLARTSQLLHPLSQIVTYPCPRWTFLTHCTSAIADVVLHTLSQVCSRLALAAQSLARAICKPSTRTLRAPLYWPHFTRCSPPLPTGILPDMNIRTGRECIRVSITVTCSAYVSYAPSDAYCSVMCGIFLPSAADPAHLHTQARADVLKLTRSHLLLSHPALSR